MIVFSALLANRITVTRFYNFIGYGLSCIFFKDRCFYISIDLLEDIALINPSFHRKMTMMV